MSPEARVRRHSRAPLVSHGEAQAIILIQTKFRYTGILALGMSMIFTRYMKRNFKILEIKINNERLDER